MTQSRIRWTDKEIEGLKRAYKFYPYRIPEYIKKRHSMGSIYDKVHRLKLSNGLRHPGIDISHLSDIEKGYIAGFMDGEGSIIFYKDRKILNPALQFPNTHKGAVEWLQKKLTTGSLAITVREKNNPKWKTLYQLHIHGAKQVYDILVVIEPYLIIKREKAQEAIRMLKEKYRFK